MCQNSQSVAARKLAEGELRALIAKFVPTQVRLVGAVRKSLQKRLPTANELVYKYRDCFLITYSPSENGYEGVLSIRGSADGVKLYFNRGKELPDLEKLLQGTSKQVRWINIDAASALTRPAVASLIADALALTQVPFALSGTGALVIRSMAAKKRGAGGT